MSVAPGSCNQCKMTGLPILPVRYTVVPEKVNPGLPSWANGDRVKSVDVGTDFKYAMRTVRTGFIYLFYEKHARGKKYWECYSVCQDGSLTLQPSTLAAKPYLGPRLLCANHSHVAVGVHYLVIEKPEKCGPTWIAFSQDKWSEETVDEYTRNTKLRNARMQTIHPAQMIEGAKHGHGAIAAADALEQVLEYAPAMNTHVLPHAGDWNVAKGLHDISTGEDGGYQAYQLVQMSTRYPWAFRFDEKTHVSLAEATVNHMQGRARAASGKPGMPHVLALWDAIGIAHELNGFRNDAAGWIKKYGDERELQISALNTYDGLQKALEQQAADFSEQRIAKVRSLPPTSAREDRARALLHANPNDAWARKELAEALAERQQQVATSDLGAQDFKKSHIAAAWPKYRPRLDTRALDLFKGKLDAFQIEAAAVVERRTQPLIHWLEAKLFLDTLNDYHGQNVEDGFLFEEAIAESIFGIGSCKVGKKKIEEWVKEAKSSMETNLLWRVVALNQDIARTDLDATLAEAQRHKSQQTQANALVVTGYMAKSLKAFADIYKKAQGVLDGNTKAASEAGSFAFGARIKSLNMRSTDKFAITVGDAVFSHFRIDKLADYASEKIIQHIFGIRAFVNPADSANLIMAQAQGDELKRAETLKRLRIGRTFMAADTPAIRTAQSENMEAAWQKFKADTSTPGKAAAVASANKDARLALVVGLIEGVNFAKLIADCKAKNDAKSWLSLLASGMSITSALFDIATVAAKNMAGIGAASWTYQGLKLWGGLLSGGATLIGGGIDLYEASNNREKGYYLLSNMYLFKGGTGLVATALSLSVTFTYSAPLIKRLVTRAAGGTAVKEVGTRSAAFIGLRILGMAIGWKVTMIIFGMQIIIWWITPDALEDWIDHSAFGRKRSTGGYRTVEEQDRKLRESLIEMGLQ